MHQLLSIFRKKVVPFSLNNDSNLISYSPILANLDEFKKDSIKMQVSLNSLRGKRIKQGFPVHGQRTRSNAKTAHRLNRAYSN